MISSMIVNWQSLIYFSVWFLNICLDCDGVDDTRNQVPKKRGKFLEAREKSRGVAEVLRAYFYAEIDGRKHQKPVTYNLRLATRNGCFNSTLDLSPEAKTVFMGEDSQNLLNIKN